MSPRILPQHSWFPKGENDRKRNQELGKRKSEEKETKREQFQNHIRWKRSHCLQEEWQMTTKPSEKQEESQLSPPRGLRSLHMAMKIFGQAKEIEIPILHKGWLRWTSKSCQVNSRLDPTCSFLDIVHTSVPMYLRREAMPDPPTQSNILSHPLCQQERWQKPLCVHQLRDLSRRNWLQRC